jgi:ADP-ribose pyrophosphatase YjhB (NUDIX family)
MVAPASVGHIVPEGAVNEPQWLIWGRELQAIAQTGLTFSTDGYDLDRYRQLRAIAVQMLSVGSDTPLERIAALYDQQVGYPTPKVDVRAAIFREGRILMVREISDGRWTLPGGWADVNQSPRECVEREVREESGFEARAIKLAAVHDRRQRNPHAQHPESIYKLFFICEITGGTASASLETSAVEFFAPDQLPQLSLGRTSPFQVERMVEHWKHPQLMTDFD